MRTLITILILFSLSTSFSQNGNTNYGLGSLQNNSSGDYNSAFGEQALFLNVSQNYQSAFGYQALYSSTSGYTNEAFGYQALYSNISGYQNSAFGTKSLYSNTSGYENIGVGYYSLSSNTTGSGNTAVGWNSLRSNTIGANNTAFGYRALYNNIDTPGNTAVGYNSLYANDSGVFNTSIGMNSLKNNSSGESNTAIGVNSMLNNTQGSDNTSVGYYSNWNANGGTKNVSLGYRSLINTSGLGNVGLGAMTETSVNDAENQIVIGYEATGQGDNSVVLGNDDVTAIYMAEDSGATVYAAGLNLDGVEVTELLASVTENGNTGFRLSTSNASNHGDIGNNAVDLSNFSDASTTTGATGNSSTAMGFATTASGTASTAMGRETIASGISSTAMGDSTTASGRYSTAMGANTTASDYVSLVVGQNNSAGSTVTNSDTDFSTENTAFVIGNGADIDNRSDALVVKFNGETTLAGNLNVNSDARLKANIVSLGSTLAKILQIDGKSYTMKKDESEKQKIGLLAQDIEKVFPELVSESNGIKSVNYQGLVPVLINALKEQEERIKRLEELLLD